MLNLSKESFTKIDGGYACHFLSVLTSEENAIDFKSHSDIFGVDSHYKFALSKVKKLGGVKYHRALFGGGIKFRTSNLESIIQSINQLN